MLARLDLPNGTQTVQSYDNLSRLTQTVNQKSGGTLLSKFAYSYDTRDVRTGVQSQHGADPLRQVSYTYDATDQLKSETASGGVANTNYSNVFNYDSMGNRTWAENVKGSDTTVTQLTPNALNQISALSQSRNGAPPVTSGFVYDAAGNTRQVENADGGKTLFDYDDADRLVRIETRNAAGVPVTKSEFVYDYASRKAVSLEFTWTAGAWVKTDETRRVFDGLDVVQERNAANEVTAQLVRDGNIGGILSRSTQAGASFFGYDGSGNVTLLTDANGDDVGRYRYDAFGNTLEASGARAAENPYRFSTKELHAQSGLYDYGYRFYSAGLGRWINRDPIREAGGVNLYAMVGNDSVNFVDSDGLRPVNKADIQRLRRLLNPKSSVDVKRAANRSIAALKSSIAAVPSGKSDPVNLQVAFWAIDRLGNEAYGFDGDLGMGWGPFKTHGKGTNKCNLFVGQAYEAVIGTANDYNTKGFPLTGRLKLGPPSANAMGNARVPMGNFSVVSSPMIGDIVAFGAKGDGSGHVTINLGGGLLIYAGEGAAKINTFDRNQQGHLPAVYRRYTP